MKRATEKKWIVGGYDEDHARQLAIALDVSPTVAGLLIARGIGSEEEAVRALRPSFEHLHDPMLMRDMPEAVARVLRAIDHDEPILIYGDYDVDGTTGTVVLRRALGLLGARTSFHVPHRFTEGYGIRREILEQAQQNGCRLVISVDCGIRAHEPLRWAREAGLDCIVTDHHLPDAMESLPPAVAVLNPNRNDCPYPDKNLAGVGVAFKLVHALLRARGREHLVNGFLKMVAIGTVADVALLTGENRTIVTLGLADLPQATNPGLRALMSVAGYDAGQNLRASDLGFRLGPRINAAGRMDAARTVIELFEATDETEAKRLAVILDSHNRQRQIVQSEIVEAAMSEMLTTDGGSHVTVIAGDGWHRGVIGLAASKIAEKHHRPAIVISLDGETGHGSARSIDAYHLLDGLDSCAELFERFGGHAHAAGLVIQRERIPELRRRLNDHAATLLTEEDFTPALHIDAELSADGISLALADELALLEPFGAGWRRPVFLTRNLRITSEARVLKEKHLKFYVAGETGHAFETLWWDGVEKSKATNASHNGTATPRCGDRIELAYCLEPNTWRDQTRLQLIVQDMKKATTSDK